ncbi:hypothetical protein [Paenibacillus soyae]|uniref:Thioredoxin family protein n=1 Tax=Paenibacillus soyae TaxID=2969249 RepID=A0A9X2MQR6_9BACL|nr:hypothetical protein [Paenibacillus soyae]MCR2806533.1 hypothetical protein [Paenibacillus soyae]
MKRWVTLLLLLLFVSIPIVIESDQGSLIREMSAREEGFYSIYVFWNEQDAADSLLGHFLLRAIHNEQARQALKISSVKYIQLDRSARGDRYFHRLGIRKTPAYVVLDHRRVVLETTDAEKVPAFLQQRVDYGQWTADVRK